MTKKQMYPFNLVIALLSPGTPRSINNFLYVIYHILHMMVLIDIFQNQIELNERIECVLLSNSRRSE